MATIRKTGDRRAIFNEGVFLVMKALLEKPLSSLAADGSSKVASVLFVAVYAINPTWSKTGGNVAASRYLASKRVEVYVLVIYFTCYFCVDIYCLRESLASAPLHRYAQKPMPLTD